MNLFKECMSLFATGVTVVTIKDMQGITINSFCSLSLTPMMVLFNLEKAAARFQVFDECKEFVVNILSSTQKEISKSFAETRAENREQYFINPNNDLPIIKDAVCHIYCSKHKVYDGGDHKIIVGLVYDMKKYSHKKPLIYYKSNYCELKNE